VFKDRNGKIIINPPRKLIENLDSLPFPARELVNYNTYLQPPGLIRGIWTNRCGNITTSRGCPGRCTYCGVNYLWGDTYRRRSVDNVLEEIDLMVSKYDLDGLYFMDDTFLMGSKWIEEFSEKFITRKYDFKWACYGRVDTVNEGMLKAVKRAGCVQVEYGIESCSERVLNKIKKRTNFKQISESIKMTKDIGIRALGSFIFGFPDDSIADLKETITSSSKIGLDFVTCYFATPYPGSEFYEQAVKENRILEHNMSNWYVRNNNIWKRLFWPIGTCSLKPIGTIISYFS
jgi:anaerobic magnesium-protoporphyrin IX monomethyl ester cyclase